MNLDGLDDASTEARILKHRIESLQRVSDYVLAEEEASYNDALERCGGQPIGHIYLHALVLNEWLAEMDKEKAAGK